MIIETENRSALYYNKYRYRARLYLVGLNNTYYTTTIQEFIQRLSRLIPSSYTDWDETKNATYAKSINLEAIEKYLQWKKINKSKVLIRVEHNIAGIFSNDLSVLKKLQKIDIGKENVSYTQVDITIPNGVKLFKRKPKHKYRVYLKSMKIPSEVTKNLNDFIERYKNTATVIVPSKSMNEWLVGKSFFIYRYCYTSYFIDYDDESTYTLLSIMIGELLHKKYKLEWMEPA